VEDWTPSDDGGFRISMRARVVSTERTGWRFGYLRVLYRSMLKYASGFGSCQAGAGAWAGCCQYPGAAAAGYPYPGGNQA